MTAGMRRRMVIFIAAIACLGVYLVALGVAVGNGGSTRDVLEAHGWTLLFDAGILMIAVETYRGVK